MSKQLKNCSVAREGQRRPKREDKKKPSQIGQNLLVTRFVLIAVGLLVVFFVVGETKVVRNGFVEPYVYFVAACSRNILRLFGLEVGGTGTHITAPGFAANIIDLCSGLGVATVFIAVVFGFPATWKNKLIGVVIGYFAIFLVNQIRIVALFVIGYKQLTILDAVHYYFSQAFVIFATAAVWLLWVSTLSAYGSKNTQAVSN